MRLDFDLAALRAFAAVARTGHVGRAAEMLNMTQSPLSRRIRDLELRLGLDLFERRGKRLILTPTGRDFLTDAQAVLDRAEGLAEKAKSLARGAGGVLRVGYVPAALNSGLLGRAAHEMAGQSCDLHLMPMRSGAQFDAIEDGRIDVGLSYRPPGAAGQHARCIHREPFLLALPTGWGPEPQALNGKPFAGPQRVGNLDAGVDLMRACGSAGFVPDLRYRVEDPFCALHLVAAGLCGAIVQTSMTKTRPPGVVLHSLPQEFPLEVALFVVGGPSPTPQATAFAKLLPTLV